MTSFECVIGSRLPSSSMREPLDSSMSSSTRTFTRWCTFTVRPLARDLEHEIGGFGPARPAGEAVHVRGGHADEHLGRQAGRGVGCPRARGVAANRSDRVGDAPELTADLTAEEAPRERATRVSTGIELTDRDELVVDAFVLQRLLHRGDHC